MSIVDGHYRHAGTTTGWNDSGVVVARRGRRLALAWDQIIAVRRVGERPGYVQLIVHHHVPASRISEDDYTVPVNSEADANRLLSAIGWHAQGRTTGRSAGRGAGSRPTPPA